ncbi:hypothetical protein BWQ96_09515 [Gracilariopsis chorda]|uniref:Uncharacterized protein n=1 Tax=Gracilariopsis chorda TaxID=448386 RepID=A0A2V3IFE1_9FLOR|nr:hypothetical protein BWQ96_09515 [Gracilariopsis chorda]|eukprot:PXF40753.1 hypothetical protein BWQ96_09515 [Gracilariopsis chorda]
MRMQPTSASIPSSPSPSISHRTHPAAKQPLQPAPPSNQLSYEQFPFEKASLSHTHYLLFPPSSYTPHPDHHAYSTSALLRFTIFPTCEQDLQRNDLLWHAVNAYSLCVPSHLQPVLHPLRSFPEASIFALGIPHTLAAFLHNVSLWDMRQAVIYMLADAAQGESEQGLYHMRHTLCPPVWNALRNVLLGRHKPSPTVDKASFLLDSALSSENSHDLWAIDVITAVSGPTTLPWMSGTILHSMYKDWMLYTACISDQRAALLAMVRLIRQGRQIQVWQRVHAIRLCATTSTSFIHCLPEHIVEFLLIPCLLAAEGGAHAVNRPKRSRSGLCHDEYEWDF